MQMTAAFERDGGLRRPWKQSQNSNFIVLMESEGPDGELRLGNRLDWKFSSGQPIAGKTLHLRLFRNTIATICARRVQVSSHNVSGEVVERLCRIRGNDSGHALPRARKTLRIVGNPLPNVAESWRVGIT
jgi:hypothetical protein